MTDEKPPHVRSAQIRGDHEALCAMGRKGARTRRLQRELREVTQALREEEALEMAHQRRDHLLPDD